MVCFKKGLVQIGVACFTLITLAWGQASPSAPEIYRLKPEDVLRVQIYNHPEIQADVPVGKDGNVSAPFVGTVKAEGRTIAELETDLKALYEKKLRLRDPVVSLTILRFRSIRASVGGYVNHPGTFEIRPGDTLVNLLNQGGGAVPDRADLRRATLRRSNSQELIPIDLFAMLIKGDTSQNYEMQDGDELNIPEETRNRILVLGTIAQPGTYQYKEPMTVADAISLAHGEVRYRSRMSKIVITREKAGLPGQYSQIQVNFNKFIQKGDATQNPFLQPGDFVFIPETNTPDFGQISQLANVAYILDRFSNGFFGIKF